MVEYTLGHTFEVLTNEVDPNDVTARQLEPGWYAQWRANMETGECVGPFPTEAKAALTFVRKDYFARAITPQSLAREAYERAWQVKQDLKR